MNRQPNAKTPKLQNTFKLKVSRLLRVQKWVLSVEDSIVEREPRVNNPVFISYFDFPTWELAKHVILCLRK